METIDVGFLSLVPPLIAIALALITKEVISSLIIGILSGGLIYALSTGGGLIEMTSVSFGVMADTVGSPGKFNIILFLALLGALLLAPALAGAWNHRTRRPFTSAASSTCFWMAIPDAWLLSK